MLRPRQIGRSALAVLALFLLGAEARAACTVETPGECKWRLAGCREEELVFICNGDSYRLRVGDPAPPDCPFLGSGHRISMTCVQRTREFTPRGDATHLRVERVADGLGYTYLEPVPEEPDAPEDPEDPDEPDDTPEAQETNVPAEEPTDPQEPADAPEQDADQKATAQPTPPAVAFR